MDILKELPIGEWPVLQKKLKRLWPLNLPGYNTLHVNLQFPKVREAFKFEVYCPYGDMENGFVGLSMNGEQACVIFSLTGDTSKLEEGIIKTKRIDWSKKVCFDLLSSLTMDSFQKVKAQMDFRSSEKGTVRMYCLPGTTAPFKDLSPPDNTYMAAVKPELIQRVNETWPYKHSNSHYYFATLASNGLSYGLYSAGTNELLAWIFINDYGYLCHLYCEQKFRKRGYGEYVMKCAVNDLLKDGIDAYGYVVHGNDKPLSIFKNLGFKHVDDCAFLVVERSMSITTAADIL